MTLKDDQDEAAELVFEVDLDAPPEKVWRALSIDAFRERWLPGEDLADPEPVASVPGEELRYRMREDAAGESLVTFQIRAIGVGGTRLRIVHSLAPAQGLVPQAANANRPPLMRAA